MTSLPTSVAGLGRNPSSPYSAVLAKGGGTWYLDSASMDLFENGGSSPNYQCMIVMFHLRKWWCTKGFFGVPYFQTNPTAMRRCCSIAFKQIVSDPISVQHQDDFRSSRDIQGVFKDFKGQGRFKIGIDRLCSVACEAAGWASTSPGIDTGAMVMGVVDGKFQWKSRGRNHQKPSNSYSQL